MRRCFFDSLTHFRKKKKKKKNIPINLHIFFLKLSSHSAVSQSNHSSHSWDHGWKSLSLLHRTYMFCAKVLPTCSQQFYIPLQGLIPDTLATLDGTKRILRNTSWIQRVYNYSFFGPRRGCIRVEMSCGCCHMGSAQFALLTVSSPLTAVFALIGSNRWQARSGWWNS